MKGLILAGKPGLTLPQDLIAKIKSDFNASRFGYAYVDDKGVITTFSGDIGPEEYEVGDIMKSTQEAYLNKKLGVAYSFVSAPDGIAEDDKQPYTVLADENSDGSEKILIAALIDSEAAKFAKEGSLHTPEYHFYKEFLENFCGDAYLEAGCDMAKLHAILDGEAKRKMVNEVLVPRGAMMLLLANKDRSKQLVTFQNKNIDLHANEKAYWASRNLLKPLEVKAPPVASVPATGTETLEQKLLRKKAEREAAGPAVAKNQVTVKGKSADMAIEQPSSPPKDSTETAAKTESRLSEHRFITSSGVQPKGEDKVPEGMIIYCYRNGAAQYCPRDTKLVAAPDDAYGQALGRWFIRNFGFKPDFFDTERPALPAFLLKAQSPIKSFMFRTLGALAILKPGQKPEDVETEMKEAAEQAERERQRPVTEGAQQVPLFVPPGAAKQFRKDFAAMPDTYKAQSKEEIEASLGQGTLAHVELGMPFEQMIRLSTRAVRNIGNNNVQTLVCMYQEVCGKLLELKPEYLAWKPEPVKAKEEPAKETLEQKLLRQKAEREAKKVA